jgi:hypothetical protein
MLQYSLKCGTGASLIVFKMCCTVYSLYRGTHYIGGKKIDWFIHWRYVPCLHLPFIGFHSEFFFIFPTVSNITLKEWMNHAPIEEMQYIYHDNILSSNHQRHLGRPVKGFVPFVTFLFSIKLAWHGLDIFLTWRRSSCEALFNVHMFHHANNPIYWYDPNQICSYKVLFLIF